MNTAAGFLWLLDSDPNWKKNGKIREDATTQPIVDNIDSTGITQENQIFFQRDVVELPAEEQLWQQKQEKSNALQTKFAP